MLSLFIFFLTFWGMCGRVDYCAAHNCMIWQLLVVLSSGNDEKNDCVIHYNLP